MSNTTQSDEERYARFAAEKRARLNATLDFVKSLDMLAAIAPLSHFERQRIVFMETRFGAPCSDAVLLRRFTFMQAVEQTGPIHTSVLHACREARRAFWDALPSGKQEEIRDQLEMW